MAADSDSASYIHWIYNDFKLASSHNDMYCTEISSSGNAIDWTLVITTWNLCLFLFLCVAYNLNKIAVWTANNKLLHSTQFEVECKAFDNNGPQLSVRGQAHTHTLSLQAHTHSVPLRPGTHTHTLVGCGGKKTQRSLGVPGGTGQGMQMIRV